MATGIPGFLFLRTEVAWVGPERHPLSGYLLTKKGRSD
jgi:hypothetical protein